MFDIIDVVLLNEEYLKELVELEKICFSDPWSETMFLGDLQSDYTCYFGTFDKEFSLSICDSVIISINLLSIFV